MTLQEHALETAKLQSDKIPAYRHRMTNTTLSFVTLFFITRRDLILSKWVLILFLVSSLFLHQGKTATSPSDATLFAPDNISQIKITLAPKDWHELRISHRREGEGKSFRDRSYQYYRADLVIDGYKIPSIGLRKKGFIGSAISTRPSLKIKFDKYQKNRRFAGTDMMTLNNNNEDLTQANQFLVYSFMRRAGVIAPRCGFARIIVNGEDLGIYSHVESIRKPFIKRHFDGADGDLYEGLYGDFTKDLFTGIVHKWGNDDDLAELKKLLNLAQSDDPIRLEKLDELLDLDSFITLWVAEVLIGFEDGYSANHNNWYLYRDHTSGQLHFIPWGADTAFRKGPLSTDGMGRKSVWAIGELCRLLWNVPESRQRYQKEMRRQLSTAWDEEWLTTELDQIIQLTKDDRTASTEEVERVSTKIQNFIKRRRQEVLTELEGVAPEFPDPEKTAPSEPSKRMTLTGTFSTTMGAPVNFSVLDTSDDTVQPVSPRAPGEATLNLSIEGEPHSPFTKFDVISGMATGIRKGYPTIRIDAKDEQSQLHWTLMMLMDPHQVRPGKNELQSNLFTTWAILIQESPTFQINTYNVLGQLNLDQFSPEKGAKVSGSFQLNTEAFKDSH